MITSCRREPAIFLLGACPALLLAHSDHLRRPNVAGMDLESPGLRTGSRSWIWSSCPGRAILSVSARLTHIRAITGSQLRRTMERVDDVDQAASFIGSATPRRSTRTLDSLDSRIRVQDASTLCRSAWTVSSIARAHALAVSASMHLARRTDQEVFGKHARYLTSRLCAIAICGSRDAAIGAACCSALLSLLDPPTLPYARFNGCEDRSAAFEARLSNLRWSGHAA